MSGEHFSFAAQVNLDDRKYMGCAREGLRRYSQTDSGSSKSLTIEALKNTEYQSEFSVNGRIKLSNGIYKGKIVPDSATELVVNRSWG
jgi:hypothetical protein